MQLSVIDFIQVALSSLFKHVLLLLEVLELACLRAVRPAIVYLLLELFFCPRVEVSYVRSCARISISLIVWTIEHTSSEVTRWRNAVPLQVMNAVRIHENKLQAAVSSQYVNVQSYLDMLVHLVSSVAEPAC